MKPSLPQSLRTWDKGRQVLYYSKTMAFGPVVSQFLFPYLIPNGQDLLLPASFKALWFSKLPPRSLINLC